MITFMITPPKTGALRRRGLSGVLCLLLALSIVLGWASRSLASDVLREAPVDDPSPQTLVLVPLDSPDRLPAALAAGLIPYGRYGGSGGEFLLAGVPPAGDRIAPDLGFPVTVLDEDPSGATYYLAVVPPGRPEPDWAAYGRVLWQDIEQALLRTTPAEAERLVEAGAEIAQVNLEPVVVQAEQMAAAAAAQMTAPDPMIQGMIDQVTSATVATYDRQLSGDLPITVGGSPYTLITRRTNSGTPILNATQFVGDHLAALGYSVEYHSWSKSGYSSRNVIGQLPGQTTPSDIFIIGAHLDDIANRPPVGPPDPGADDNASGSTAVLVAADILSQYYWGCTLRFALWTGEEQGMLGSDVYAARSKTGNENIRGYLNLDMLGYNGTGALAPREVNLFWKSTVPSSQQIADTFISVNSTYGLNLIPFKYDALSYTIGNQSDNSSFWNRGYPAIMAIEDYYGDFTPYYHTKNDLYSNLDLDYFTSMVKAAVGTFAHMSGCLIPDGPIHVLPSLPGSNAVNLKWYQTAPNSTYEIWRNSTGTNNPYFAPGSGAAEQIGTQSAPNLGIMINYPDANASGDPDANHFYLVRGKDASGAVAATSQRVGVFSYTLIP